MYLTHTQTAPTDLVLLICVKIRNNYMNNANQSTFFTINWKKYAVLFYWSCKTRVCMTSRLEQHIFFFQFMVKNVLWLAIFWKCMLKHIPNVIGLCKTTFLHLTYLCVCARVWLKTFLGSVNPFLRCFGCILGLCWGVRWLPWCSECFVGCC